jgi:glycosyltransferase involved in cell wall biosynthesis
VNGVARTRGRLVEHASRRGHEVALVTPRVGGGPAAHAAHHRQLFGVPIPLYRDLQLARGLDGEAKRMLADFAPDLVHIATESTVGYSARLWAARKGIPLVTSYHTNFPAYLPDYHLGALEPVVWRYLRWFHGRSLRTFCPNRDTLEGRRAHGFHDRLSIWSRGVDTRLFSPARRVDAVRCRLAPGADELLVYVGRLAAEKRVEVVMEAYRKVRAALGAKVAMVFVGDGPAVARLRAGAPEGVTFTGFLRGVPPAEAYAAADLFVFASDTETFGNVCLAALTGTTTAERRPRREPQGSLHAAS